MFHKTIEKRFHTINVTQTHSQSPLSFLKSDPNFVVRTSNETKIRNHHLTLNKVDPKLFQDGH